MLYRVYTADSLYFITRYVGVTGMKRYSEILYPAPEDNREPDEIARERAANLGLKIVS